MSAYFNLTLDTTAPTGVGITINGGMAATNNQLVDLALTVSDSPATGYQMKIWGIAGAATEADASWETFAATKQVTLTPGDGAKTVYAKFRDDVWNESAQVSAAITLNTAVPAVTVLGPDRSKISKVSCMDTSVFTFRADVDVAEYKVCVVTSENATHTQGTQIPGTAGSENMSGGAVTANTEVSCTVKAADIEIASAGDGIKIVKVFAKTSVGTWSV